MPDSICAGDARRRLGARRDDFGGHGRHEVRRKGDESSRLSEAANAARAAGTLAVPALALPARSSLAGGRTRSPTRVPRGAGTPAPAPSGSAAALKLAVSTRHWARGISPA